MKSRSGNIWVYIVLTIFVCGSCSEKAPKKPALFRALDSKRTGLHFSNELKYTPEFNLFKYMYFYNGSGVGAGDFNNDGRIDLFFGSNQQQNKLFLNNGALSFRDVSDSAGIPGDGGWSTGISVVDINNDGLLDIYVCRVGQYETLKGNNLLLINEGVGANGIPRFRDQAKEYGLDFSGFSTQAAFFDFDNDGDLDMFLLNHSIHHNNSFRPRNDFTGTYDPLSGDRIFRNDAQTFTDVTAQTGINSTSIGYGLGIAIADANVDGYPDIYIGNDFHENDYLYINQKNGTFRETGTDGLMHTSQYSMGVDVADINNDAYPEIISVDMLSANPYILKRSLGESSYDVFTLKTNNGYSHQYTRNNLQYNRRNGMFSEVGLYSGVAATDWSWAPLWMDFDNDGLKDLFISNGIPKRMNDIDYVNFVSSGEVQQKITNNDMQGKDISLINKFPEIKIPNKFYHNKGNLSFSDVAGAIEGNIPTFSNGAVYADLDGDGDLDIVVNNIGGPALLYENVAQQAAKTEFATVRLQGPANNRNAVGARVLLFCSGEVRTYEHHPAKGFLSSMQVPIHLGLENTRVDSLFVVWPDRTYTRVDDISGLHAQPITWQPSLPLFNFKLLTERHPHESFPVTDITSETISYVHAENRFVEFDREPLIPQMISTEGPAVAVADVNGDGLEDVFLGGARDKSSALFLQSHSGRFVLQRTPVLDADSIYENTDACWADINRDGHPDLIVASGGNEYYGADFRNSPRIYINDGRANLTRLEKPFGSLYMTASSIVPSDFNGDGYIDFFIGGRAVPWGYGQVPRSYLFLNNRQGGFDDVTDRYANGLAHAGFVKRALWFDLDKDGDSDLLLSLEWGNLVAFMNANGHFSKKVLSEKRGWWNFILPCDVDGDGDIDLVAGNLGENTRLSGSPEKPVRLYYNDFDGNGQKEQVVTYYMGDKEIPFASKAELEKQMPVLRKKFLYAADFADASLTELFGNEKLAKADVLTAAYFSSVLLLNRGGLNFEARPLPWEAQLSAFKDAAVVDANGDDQPDVLLVGNFYSNTVEIGRSDADFGTLLINRGGGNFTAGPINGAPLRGEVRRINTITIGNKTAYLLAKNNDTARVIGFSPR